MPRIYNVFSEEANEILGRMPSWIVRKESLAICEAFGGLQAGTFSCTSVDKDSFLLEERGVNARESKRIYLFYPASKNGMWFKRIDTAETRGGKSASTELCPGPCQPFWFLTIRTRACSTSTTARSSNRARTPS